jgi:predicted metal-dependent peptidase
MDENTLNKVQEIIPFTDIKGLCETALKARPFYGILWQYLRTQLDSSLPAAAGIYYCPKSKRIVLIINPNLMGIKKSDEERLATIFHEIGHIVLRHIFKKPGLETKNNPELKLRWNIAMDMVINQTIDNLSEGLVDYKDFKDKDGNPFPADRTTEEYFDLLENVDLSRFDWNINHDWDIPDDALEDMANTLKKAVFKARKMIVNDKKFIKDLGSAQTSLEMLEKALAALNYKNILNYAIRKSLPTKTRTYTWKRPSKRYGYQAPGTKCGENPRVCIYVDTSGSVGELELLEQLGHAGNILRTLNAEMIIKMFHTEIYGENKFKPGSPVVVKNVETGGTDLEVVFKDIYSNRYDLSIILTDGHYDTISIPPNENKKVVFIISKEGQAEHPLTKYGITVKSA